MSTMTKPKRSVTLPPADNPYYYGWRDVFRTLPDGTRKHERIPLTLEDALHPQMGDYIVESNLHDMVRAYLAGVFRYRTADDPRALVLSDTGVYWDHPDLEHHAPDVCVIFGLKQKKQPVDWTSFFVRDEGVRPHTIVEIVSVNTRDNDVVKKVEEYHLVEVPFYYIFDKEHEEDPWTLRGYQWTPIGYLPLNADPKGRMWLSALGIWLAAEGHNIVCYDGKTNERIGDYVEHTQRLKQTETSLRDAIAREEAEKQRAETERIGREAAEAKIKEIEAELARLRGQ